MTNDIRDYWHSHGDELSAHYGRIIARNAMREMGKALSPAGKGELGGDWLFSLSKLWHQVAAQLLREASDYVTNVVHEDDSDADRSEIESQDTLDLIRQLTAIEKQILALRF